MIRSSTLSIGENRGQPRIWIEGRYLHQAGFRAGSHVSTDYGQSRITIRLDESGEKKVSQSRKAGRYPVLDYNSAAVGRALATAKTVRVETSFGRIVITPSRTERRRALRRRDGTVGSAFSGGGLLDEAARQTGYRTVFAIESDPDYADIWQANHTGAMHEGCISQVEMRKLPQVDLLVMGIPCEPFSPIRRQAAGVRRLTGELPERHELADLSVWALMLVDAVNPTTVLIEQVPQYLRSGIGTVTLSVLERMGYSVASRVIDGTEFGALTRRQRCVIVATDGPIRWPRAKRRRRTLAEVLLPPEHPECRWFDRQSKPWLFEHWDRQTARGNGFASQQLAPETACVQAITKRYFAGQGDNPVVRDVRPGRDGWFRWLTLGEVKRIMGLPESYDLGPTLTRAGEVLGQGVQVDVFQRIIESAAPLRARGRRSAGQCSTAALVTSDELAPSC